ncbi:MAG TPA: winged helix-turn-helix domain-containing protein [Terriglobales bacterium]|nr:winged helix-turn-helix domain-containing protein [Terriglobales bacterium]
MSRGTINNAGPFRFGESFELDIERHELRRYGQLVRLERIPLDILILLAEKRGEVVSREEMVASVWGAGTYLDTDNAINGAIRKIRQVLKDNPEEPKYIQTIPNKGYRFIAEIQPRVTTVEPKPEGPQEIQPNKVRSKWVPFAAAAVLVVVAMAAYFATSRSARRPEISDRKYMLAVLPFENLTGDPNQDYFTDGLTEEMISHLGNLDPEHLGVIARTSVMQYKNNRDGLSRVGQELGVDYVLEGSVRRESGKVRITAQLILMKDQTHIWARQYDRALTNILELENELANEVAQEITLTLIKKRDANSRAPRTMSPREYAAYDAYLRGRYFWNRRTVEGFQQAIQAFEEAVEKDPDYALAYVGLADTYALLSAFDIAPKSESMPKAREAAAKALALDDKLAEAHASMALIVQNYDWDWPKAEAEYKRAIELDPNYATAHHWYAEFLTLQSRFSEALDEIERARLLDPRSLIISSDRGAILYSARRYREAIQQFREVLQMEPNFRRARIIVFAYAAEGLTQDALREAAESQKVEDGPFTWALQAYAHGRAGQKSEAKRFLHKLEEERSRRYVNSSRLITANLGVGDYEQALKWCEQGLSERATVIPWLRVDPLYDPLRSDPRFHALLAKAGLE